MRSSLLVLVLVAACDDHVFPIPGGTPTGQSGWCAVQATFDATCVGCHSPAGGSQGGLDLQTDPWAAIVGVESANYPGRILVVTGDPASSLLLAKMQGTQASSEGEPMPLGGQAPQAAIDAVSAWIADGASAACNGDTGPTILPVCDDANEQCRPGTCGGEGGNMLPGADCLQCHTPGSGTEAPRWTAAGTAFADLYGSKPLSGAAIHLEGADGAGFDLVTNGVGNFWTDRAIALPFTATITTAAGSRSMGAEQSTGGCNSCHQCGGAAGGKLNGP